MQVQQASTSQRPAMKWTAAGIKMAKVHGVILSAGLVEKPAGLEHGEIYNAKSN